MAAQRKCRFCLYWHSRLPAGYEPKDDSLGECRFNPPAFVNKYPTQAASDKRGLWPETSGKDWCGQFTVSRWPQTRSGFPTSPN